MRLNSLVLETFSRGELVKVLPGTVLRGHGPAGPEEFAVIVRGCSENSRFGIYEILFRGDVVLCASSVMMRVV
jgi:hypothetical protein